MSPSRATSLCLNVSTGQKKKTLQLDGNLLSRSERERIIAAFDRPSGFNGQPVTAWCIPGPPGRLGLKEKEREMGAKAIRGDSRESREVSELL